MTKTITYKGITKEVDYWKDQPWDKPLTTKMKQFEKETGQHAIWRGKVSGSFVYWLYWKPSKNKPKKSTKKKSTKKSRLDSKLYINKEIREVLDKDPKELTFYEKRFLFILDKLGGLEIGDILYFRSKNSTPAKVVKIGINTLDKGIFGLERTYLFYYLQGLKKGAKINTRSEALRHTGTPFYNQIYKVERNNEVYVIKPEFEIKTVPKTKQRKIYSDTEIWKLSKKDPKTLTSSQKRIVYITKKLDGLKKGDILYFIKTKNIPYKIVEIGVSVTGEGIFGAGSTWTFYYLKNMKTGETDDTDSAMEHNGITFFNQIYKVKRGNKTHLIRPEKSSSTKKKTNPKKKVVKYEKKKVNVVHNKYQIKKLIETNVRLKQSYHSTLTMIKRMKSKGSKIDPNKLREAQNKLNKFDNSIYKNNMKIFDLAKEANLKMEYMSDPNKSGSKIYYIEEFKPNLSSMGRI